MATHIYYYAPIHIKGGKDEKVYEEIHRSVDRDLKF